MKRRSPFRTLRPAERGRVQGWRDDTTTTGKQKRSRVRVIWLRRICHRSGDPALFGGHLVRRRAAGEAARHRDGLLGFWSHVPQKPEHMPDKAEAK